MSEINDQTLSEMGKWKQGLLSKKIGGQNPVLC